MKQKRFLMGIDNGGSNIKCAIFDLDGTEVAAADTTPPTCQPREGFVERDPDAVWKCNCEVIAAALRGSGIRPDQIAAVSLCGYGGGICLVDRDGQPVCPNVVSTDTRARRNLEELYRSGAAGRIFEITHQYPWAGQPAALLRWFREERPALFSRAAFALSIKDYIRGRLTHEFAAELTDASNFNLVDPATGSYSERLFHISGLADSKRLFGAPLLHPASVAGTVTQAAAEQTGLTAGTPVAAGLYDVSSCATGSAALGAGSLAVTIGTWSMASCLDTSFSKADDSTIVTTSALDRHFLLEQGSATGAVNFNWYLDRFISKMYPDRSKRQLYALCDQAILQPDAQNKILFIPYLYASCTHPNGKGAFFNLSGHHTDQALLAAVMEGILLCANRHISLLKKGVSTPFQAIRLSGGICASPAWSQILCDILQAPVCVMEGSQQGARGAAMCAGIAVGEFDGFSQAAEAMVHTASVLSPRAQYAQLYALKANMYEKALKALDYFHEQN